jgi:hypothetical protein
VNDLQVLAGVFLVVLVWVLVLDKKIRDLLRRIEFQDAMLGLVGEALERGRLELETMRERWEEDVERLRGGRR